MSPRSFTAALALVLAGLCHPPACVADAFVPADDAVVLERLPVSPLDPHVRQLRTLRGALASRPDDLALATQVAWRCIEQGRALADPRYYGYAQSALAPWWDAPEPPVPVLVLRATIRQYEHDFAGALDDLALALRADPDHAQAWLTRAVVLQVRGEYAEARRSCLEVLQRSAPLVAVTCTSGVDGMSGQAAAGYDRLRRALAQAPAVDAAARRWALTTLAEIAARIGRPEVAQQHFREAVALGDADDYLLGAYADFLLDESRPAAVRALLDSAPRTDGVLLRLVLADKLAGTPELADDLQALRDRFAAARRRGDTIHRREEARFALHVLDDPTAALALARENWAVQREPWDARLLLEAALAAGDREAARPVLRFLARSGLEGARLGVLSERLREDRS